MVGGESFKCAFWGPLVRSVESTERFTFRSEVYAVVGGRAVGGEVVLVHREGRWCSVGWGKSRLSDRVN